MTMPQSQNLLEIHAEHSDPAMWATMMLTKDMGECKTVGDAHKAIANVLGKALSRMMDARLLALRTLISDRLRQQFKNQEGWTIQEVLMEIYDEIEVFKRGDSC